READVIVGPVAAVLVAIGITRPVVELGAEQDIDRQAILCCGPAEPAGWHLGPGGTLANYVNMRQLFDDAPVTREQDTNIGPRSKRSRQCGGNGSQPAHPDE